MALDHFQRQAKASLAVYKREVLGITEDGIWRKNKRPYPHILPIAQRRLNILPSIREAFWDWFRDRGIALHSDFHHLNSSQALCFNLFFSLLSDNGRPLGNVLDALRISGEPVPGATFEFRPNEVEGTCFDFMIPTALGARVYFELKYSESKFGGARTDIDHLDKFRRVYQPRLHGRFEDSFCCEAPFLANYQIVRNIWHLDYESGDNVVFLFPRANTSLCRQEAIIRNCAAELYKSRVHIVYLEDLLTILRMECKCSHFEIATLAEFEAKYFRNASRVQITDSQRTNCPRFV